MSAPRRAAFSAVLTLLNRRFVVGNQSVEKTQIPNDYSEQVVEVVGDPPVN